MASILRVNTLTDASSNNSIATSVVFNGTAKVWANVDAENSTMAIFDSFNVSSVDDGGSGKVTVNINNNMSSADYCFLFGVANGSGFNDSPTLNIDGSEPPTASVFKFYSLMGGSLNDARRGCVSINGDYA